MFYLCLRSTESVPMLESVPYKAHRKWRRIDTNGKKSSVSLSHPNTFITLIQHAWRLPSRLIKSTPAFDVTFTEFAIRHVACVHTYTWKVARPNNNTVLNNYISVKVTQVFRKHTLILCSSIHTEDLISEVQEKFMKIQIMLLGVCSTVSHVCSWQWSTR